MVKTILGTYLLKSGTVRSGGERQSVGESEKEKEKEKEKESATAEKQTDRDRLQVFKIVFVILIYKRGNTIYVY